ncbi:hypothetical protein [Lewinella sp. 4G2]|uniref:hypothetical protein n=1 Tax=Lewinella sp. 4G2 TaxID=1803372 RepID=UPI0007B4B7B2|nr:hypothetical protein [Lewinella sp. 4G2]OAV43867.1 hypothetical protein A3850_004855 [Lewinella sp. 4G2]
MSAPTSNISSITSSPVHITYRLHGSVSEEVLLQLGETRDQQLALLEAELKEATDKVERSRINQRKYETLTAYDTALVDALNAAKGGPKVLMDPGFQQLIIKSWRNLDDRGIVSVIMLCVMRNHVHVIVKAPDDVKSVSSAAVMESHTGLTTCKARQHLGLDDRDLWDSAYHDRRIRPGKFLAAVRQILEIPKRAGLAKSWKNWPGVYVNPEYVEMLG